MKIDLLPADISKKSTLNNLLEKYNYEFSHDNYEAVKGTEDYYDGTKSTVLFFEVT